MKKLFLNFVIIISSAVVLIILMFFTSGVDEVVKLLVNARYEWIATAFICMLIYWFLDGMILHTIASAMSERQPVRNTMKVTMIGQFFNCLTPFGSGGQPVQIYLMAKDGVNTGHAASIVIIKSLLHQVIIVMYTIAAFISVGAFFHNRVPQFYLIYLAGLTINVLFLLFYALFLLRKDTAGKILLFVVGILKWLRVLKDPEGIKARIENELKSLNNGASVIRHNYGVMFKLLILQVVQYTFYFAIPFFIFLAIEKGFVNFWSMVAAQSIVTMIQLLVPSPGSIGGAEGASYLFFSLFFRANIIIPVILIWRIITYYFSILAGGIFSMLSPEKPLTRTN